MEKKTTRVDLADGAWAEVRGIVLGDLVHIAHKKHERGFDDDVLDFAEIIPRVVVSWSKPEPISDDTAAGLSQEDAVAIMLAARGEQKA